MKDVLILGFGGFFGTLSRYYLQQLLNKFVSFPLGTLIVNITGCLIIGFIYGVVLNKTSLGDDLSNGVKLFFITGFCGGYTTFSSFAYECIDLVNKGYFINSLTYMILSIVFGFIFCYFGLFISKLIL